MIKFTELPDEQIYKALSEHYSKPTNYERFIRYVSRANNLVDIERKILEHLLCSLINNSIELEIENDLESPNYLDKCRKIAKVLTKEYEKTNHNELF